MELLQDKTIAGMLLAHDEKLDTTDTQHYTLQDILDKLNLVNTGLAVTKRDKAYVINKAVILNPYSAMYVDANKDDEIEYVNNEKQYVLETSIYFKRIPVSIANVVYNFVENNYDAFADVMPGLTMKNLYQAIYNEKRKRHRKREERYVNKNDAVHSMASHKKFHDNSSRLYPLSIERYNEFASTFYRKNRMPKLNKRFVDGIQFGAGDFKKYKIGRSDKQITIEGVESRVLGLVQLEKDGVSRIALHTEDGVWIRVKKRKNGYSIWEMILCKNMKYKYCDSIKQVYNKRYYGRGKFKIKLDLRKLNVYLPDTEEKLFYAKANV